MRNLHLIEKLAVWLISAAFIASLGSGCAGTQPFPPLEQAQNTYSRAKSDPDVEAYAPVALYEAKEALDKAESAGNKTAKTHLSYLAEKKAQIAIAEAERKKAEKEISNLQQEKENIILESRRVETEQARQLAARNAMEAQAAREDAIRLKQAAENRSREAEQARQEALRMKQQAEAAMQRSGQLESELSELKARRTDRGIVLTLGDVLFALNQAELTAGATRTIDKLAQFLKNHPDRTVKIEGHTDNTGSDQYNQYLSEQRALAVKTALLQRGISADRMTTRGYGEQNPIAPNDTALGRQQNRRVEIIISEDNQAPAASPSTPQAQPQQPSMQQAPQQQPSSQPSEPQG